MRAVCLFGWLALSGGTGTCKREISSKLESTLYQKKEKKKKKGQTEYLLHFAVPLELDPLFLAGRFQFLSRFICNHCGQLLLPSRLDTSAHRCSLLLEPPTV